MCGPRGFEQAAVFSLSIHAERVVDVDADSFSPGLDAHVGDGNVWLSECEYEERDSEKPGDEYEQMSQAGSRLCILLDLAEKTDICKINLFESSEIKQVDDNGEGKCEQSKEKTRIDKMHWRQRYASQSYTKHN